MEENAVYFSSLLCLIVSLLHFSFTSANPLLTSREKLLSEITACGMPMFWKPIKTVTVIFYFDDDELVRAQTMVPGNDVVSISCWEGFVVVGVEVVGRRSRA